MSAPPRRGLGLTVADAVARIRTREHIVHAFVTARLEEALAEARAPRPGPLSGVPFGLKDVWDVAGWPTTRGSVRNKNYLPTVSGPIARTFLDAGAVLLGKTNVSDLALTPESASLVGGRTTNPHDPARTSGGSSGGAAAAVADGMAAFDWGSDFGGSIRLPAAFCGIVGLRLSSAVWPPEGKPYNVTESHLNGQGPMTATLADCRRLLGIAAPRLRTGPPSAWRARGICLLGPDPAKVGAWPGFVAEATALAVKARVPVEPVPMPGHDVIDAAFVALLSTTLRDWKSRGVAGLASLTLGRLIGAPRFHPDSARVLVELAILRALRHRSPRGAVGQVEAVRDACAKAWDAGLAIVSPSTVYPAPLHGKTLKTPGIATFAKLGNLADATGLSVPWGTFSTGLPRGLQLLGPPGAELGICDLAERLVPGV